MDNVTHTLVGLALSRAGLRRFSPRAAAILLLSANAPDADIIALAGGGLRYFEWHRGYTHTILGLPFMAAITVAVVALAGRQRLPWWRAWGIACIGVASHLLIDWTNTYGVRFLLPFSSRWFQLDTTGLYDAALMAVLLLAAALPYFAGLVSSEIGSRHTSAQPGQGSARFALLFFLLFDCARGVLHHRAVQQLDARLYDGEPPLVSAAFPDPFDPLAWNGAVESERAFYLFAPAPPGGDVAAGEPQIFYKPAVTAAWQAARAAEPFRFLSYFARFPIWSEESVEGNNRVFRRVELTDLRFGRPRQGAFHAIALIDSLGHARQTWFTYSDGSKLGSQSPE